MPASVAEIHDRLDRIFPVGVQVRPNVVSSPRAGQNQPGARTVFVALYTGSVAGTDRWIGPKHIVWMGPTQAADRSDPARLAYSSKPEALSDRWYKENSRELRDKVITKGLLAVGAMMDKPGLPVTSSVPRYALAPDFAALFDPALTGPPFDAAAEAWRKAHLNAAAMGRIALARRTMSAASVKVTISFPGGGGIVLPEGPSPVILKAVIEEFGPRFMGDPQVLWVSDSRIKQAYKNDALEAALGIKIDVAKTLPDLIMVDMNPPGRPHRFLLVFCEAVASEGPIDELRQQDLIKILTKVGFGPDDGAFLTAYLDKVSATYRASAHELAWRSFAWFVSEPDCLMHLREATNLKKMAELL